VEEAAKEEARASSGGGGGGTTSDIRSEKTELIKPAAKGRNSRRRGAEIKNVNLRDWKPQSRHGASPRRFPLPPFPAPSQPTHLSPPSSPIAFLPRFAIFIIIAPRSKPPPASPSTRTRPDCGGISPRALVSPPRCPALRLRTVGSGICYRREDVIQGSEISGLSLLEALNR